MRILAVETSGARGGIALADGPKLLEEVRLAEGLRHGRDLVLAVKEACLRAGWDRRHIQLAAVSIGPGSFTGIRIGVTLAKVLAFDAATKVVAVPSFRALAENAPADRRRVATVVDAKRGGLFASIFERRPGGAGAGCGTAGPPRHEAAGGGPGAGRGAAGCAGAGAAGGGAAVSDFAEVFGPALVEPQDLARRLEPPALVLGHGITKGRSALGAFELAGEDLWDIRPSVVARLGLAMAERGEFADPMHLAPLYIRPPEAEEIWERRQRKGA